MSALSVRKLPKDLEKALEREAKKRHLTKSDLVILALENFLHLGAKEARKEKLQNFFGKMSEDDLKEFKKTTAVFETIDKEMWE